MTTYYAIAVLKDEVGTNIQGYVKFTQKAKKSCEIQARIINATPGLHGFHIHQYGNIIDGCMSTGGHYNPDGKDHGAPDDKEKHVGDLGNIKVLDDGTGELTQTRSDIYIYGTKNNVLGRAIVMHAGMDDEGRGGDAGSKASGNAGPRQACGVIGVYQDETTPELYDRTAYKYPGGKVMSLKSLSYSILVASFIGHAIYGDYYYAETSITESI